jgi:hypothetical protein
MKRAFKDLCPGGKPDHSLALAVGEAGPVQVPPGGVFPIARSSPGNAMRVREKEMVCESAASREAAKEFSPRRKAVSGLVGN